MSEILKRAFEKPQALTQSKHFNLLHRGEKPNYFWDLYPMTTEYYHEFNPYFVHSIPDQRVTVFPAFPVFTVRDGYIAFADFLLKYWKAIPKWKTTFLIPDSYTPLLPESLRGQFLSYRLTQKADPTTAAVKKVTIAGHMTSAYFGNYAEIERKLSLIRELPSTVRIEVCIQQRRNPFFQHEKENFHWVNIPEVIRKSAGNREVSFLRLHELMERSTFSGSLLIDLMVDTAFSCDSYLHFFYLGRGGVIAEYPVADESPALAAFDVSFNQRLSVHSLPAADSCFSELIFYQKLHRGDICSHPGFHALLRKILNVKIFEKDDAS